MEKQKNKRAFTLIELLIVIAIIGLLASVVLVQFPGAAKRARDSERLQDISQILTALRIHQTNTGNWPSISSDSCCDGWDQGPCASDQTFVGALISEGSITVMPVDPLGGTGTGCYGYNYYRYGAGSYGCDASRGDFFVLGVRDMETSSRPHPDSLGWSCSGRDWQNEFDWVIGGFQY